MELVLCLVGAPRVVALFGLLPSDAMVGTCWDEIFRWWGIIVVDACEFGVRRRRIKPTPDDWRGGGDGGTI
jgi:hypothetical protein